MCFFEKKCTRRFKLKQKSDFLIRNEYLAFGFTAFAKNADSIVPGGTLPPLISATAKIEHNEDFSY